ncbi:hypothetical protein AAF712_013675 [Marasmius tenuissimus]|uniref:DNA primase/polymerase bifunctional N-terminal domain-containing protein n=1 Tax=Marasmius tenuissimus TaxID=585030 RepID=A0ABR2ZED5_9AGAR
MPNLPIRSLSLANQLLCLYEEPAAVDNGSGWQTDCFIWRIDDFDWRTEDLEVPGFRVGCFSVNSSFPHDSTCVATDFDDVELKRWLKKHAAFDKPIAISDGGGYIYIFRIDGIDLTDVVEGDLSKTVVFKQGRGKAVPIADASTERFFLMLLVSDIDAVVKQILSLIGEVRLLAQNYGA